MYSYLMRIPLHCKMKTAEQKHVSTFIILFVFIIS